MSSVAYVLLPTAETCICLFKKYVVFDGHIDLCLHVNTRLNFITYKLKGPSTMKECSGAVVHHSIPLIVYFAETVCFIILKLS